MGLMNDYDRQVIKKWSCADFHWLAVSAAVFDNCDILYYGLIIFQSGARELTYWSQWEIEQYNEHTATPIQSENKAVYGTLAEEMTNCIRQTTKGRKRARK